MERKNKLKAVLLVVLVITTAFVFWYSRVEKTSGVDKKLFRLPDYQSINKVKLEAADKKVELAFNGARWKVNEKYNADRNLIQVLFATFQQAEPKRAVAAAQRDSLKNLLQEHGTKVSLYNGDKIEQQFIAGGNAAKTQAYFQLVGQDEIYVMNIPGYRVYVSGILELSENQWRDKLVFAFNWENFQRLSVEFSEKPSENFSVSMQNNSFGVEGLAKTDTARLNTFLDNVSLLAANEFLERGKLVDSLKALTPFMTIRAFDIGKREYTLSLFRDTGNVVPGLVQNEDGVTFSRVKIQPIIRPKSFFKRD
jgi:hypothetical protein